MKEIWQTGGIKLQSYSRPGSPVLRNSLLPSFLHGTNLPAPKAARSPLRLLSALALLALVFFTQISPPSSWHHGHMFRWQWTPPACEARGLGVSPPWEDTAIAIHVKAVDEGRQVAVGKVVEEGVRLSQVFHPALTALRALPRAFSSRAVRLPPSAQESPDGCIVPAGHVVQFVAPPPRPARDPTFFHSMCTTPERINTFAPTWSHFLSATPKAGAATGCLVVDASGTKDAEAQLHANSVLQQAGTTCVFADTSLSLERRYELRILQLVHDAWDMSERQRLEDDGPLVEWFIIADDDTWWVDQALLKDRLAKFDFTEDHFLGAHSETQNNINMFGKIAYGGAGIIISRGLMSKMQEVLPTCFEKFGEIWGGDSMLTHCAAYVKEKDAEEVVEVLPGLAQMDMKGDANGFFSGGLGPFLTVHHWAGWLEILPGRDQNQVIDLFRKTVNAVGGQNLLRRWVFDNGGVVWSLGHSVVVYRDALNDTELEQVERTWEDHIPIRPYREGRREGIEKLTYYLTAVEQLSDTTFLFRHECTSRSVAKSVKEIVVLWERPSDLDV